MPRRKKLDLEPELKEKLDYLGLDLQKIPEDLLECQNLNYKIIKNYDEKQYKQYRFVDVKNIQIMLSGTNRLNSVKEKYENAKPLMYYLDYQNQENISYYTTFLEMLKRVQTYEIDKVEEEQKKLSKKIPFKVKFEGNYLWQIYYSEYDDKYFMIVPTEDSDYSTFFYLLKRKIEANKNEKIYVPVSYVDYSANILRRSEIKDLENYLWLFTKDYPLIYEVYDKKEKPSIQIIGETEIYDKIKTVYKVCLNSAKEANKFYKLVKALFILQSELPNYYEFETNVNEDGELKFVLDNVTVEYEILPEFIVEQFLKSVSLKNKTEEELVELKQKMQTLKEEGSKIEAEYMAKEKQISTYLECKKTFFGKVKYFFKFGKKSSKQHEKATLEDIIDTKRVRTANNEKFALNEKNYTLDELIDSYKELESKETEKKNLVMDINAQKLKNKNLKRKLQNATAYIDEINKHKRSIFEFWKYSNKDEVASLEEGEEEEFAVKEMEKVFSFEDDFEKFGNKMDKLQRKFLTDDEFDSVFVASTDVFDLINKVYKEEVENREISAELKKLKQQKEEKMEEEAEESFDIFGKINSVSDYEKTIGNRIHRETERDVYDILEIKKGTKGVDLKNNLENTINNIKSALEKIKIERPIYAYKACNEEIDVDGMQKFSLDIKQELEDSLDEDLGNSTIYLYKIKIPAETNLLAFSNIIFYNNRNMTLPVGMNLSKEILVDLSDKDIKTKNQKELNKLQFINERDDFSNIKVRKIVAVDLW